MPTLKQFILQPVEDIIEQIKSGNAETFENSLSYVITPKFRAGQTGCSRRDINVWRKENLLPNTLEENTWNLFSISECIWLRFVSMLKKFGVKQQTILQIKSEMFPTTPETIKQCFTNLQALPLFPEAFNNYLREIILEIDKDPETLLSEITESGFSIWAIIVMLCCKLHMKYAAIVDEDSNYLLLNIGKPLENNTVNVPELIIKQMSSRSYLLINIHELCKDFFENEKVIIDSEYYFGLLNSNEQKVISELRTDKYIMVTVMLDNGSITHLKLTKKGNENEPTYRKMSRMFKTNEYKDIELKTRDGKIVKLFETDIKKLNNK